MIVKLGKLIGVGVLIVALARVLDEQLPLVSGQIAMGLAAAVLVVVLAVGTWLSRRWSRA